MQWPNGSPLVLGAMPYDIVALFPRLMGMQLNNSEN